MNTYDPSKTPNAREWLAIDEGMRYELVRSYHRRTRVRPPNSRLHAAMHVAVENQIALGEPAVVETLGRLLAEGLQRHNAIHAIGSVLADHMQALLKGAAPPDPAAANRDYAAALRRLTAAGWLNAV